MNFYTTVITVILVNILFLWITAGVITVVTSSAVMSKANMQMNGIHKVFALLLWPMLIKDALTGYKDLIIQEAAKQAAGLKNNTGGSKNVEQNFIPEGGPASQGPINWQDLLRGETPLQESVEQPVEAGSSSDKQSRSGVS